MKFKIKPLVLVLALCLALVPILSFENRSASSSLAPNGTSRLYSTQSSGSRYYVDLGEIDPTLTGYSFSFDIPAGYTISSSTEFEIELLGPTVMGHMKIAEDEWYTAEVGPDWMSGGWHKTIEEDNAESRRDSIMALLPGTPTCTPGQRKVNGYDDYYFFYESSVNGVMGPGILGVWGVISLGEVGPFEYEFGMAIDCNPSFYYQTIGGVRMNEVHEQLLNEIFASIQISGEGAPTASFTYSPSCPAKDEDVQFTDTSTDPDGTIVSWEWDFGDGGTSTEQNPTHQYTDEGTYTVTLTVTDDDGLTDSHSEILTVGGLRVESEYEGFFLHNVNAITNTYEAIPPSGTPINKVVFDMDGKTQTDYSSPWEAEFNMGDVGLNPTLVVTAYKAGGGTISTSLEPEILETPALLSHLINSFYDMNRVTVSKRGDDYWKMKINGTVSRLVAAMTVMNRDLPFNIGNGYYYLPIPSWPLRFTIESDDYNKRVNFGALDVSYTAAEFMGNGGLSFGVGLSGGFTVRPGGQNEITTPTITISIGGSVSWTYSYQTVVPTPVIPIPVVVYVSPYFGAALDTDWGIGESIENPIALYGVSGNIGGGAEVRGGPGIKGASAGAYFDGSVNLYFVAPTFDFEKLRIEAKVGVYVEFGRWKVRRQLWSGSWSSNPGTNASSQSVSEWELSERDYLGPGYSTLAWTEGNREGALIENVFSNPQPSTAMTESGGMVAVWTYDDPGKEPLQALEIAYSVYDPERRAWSEASIITSDNVLDYNPTLTYIGNNQVLAVWQRVPRELENVASPLDHAGDTELTYSAFDLNTGEWSAPQLLTTNNAYEAPPTLASNGGMTQLIYLKDSDNNPFTLDDQTLVATEWAGGSWSAEETIASGITVIGSPRLSLAAVNEGILTFVRDMDDNVLTTDDREVFYLRYDGNWEEPTRLTTNNMGEMSLSAGWANNRWFLSWIEMEPMENELGYTTSVRFAELANGQLVEKGILFENQGVTDQFLLGEIQDKLHLLYQVGARGAPRLIQYDGSAWESVDNFLWSPKVENARTSQLSVSVGGNHLGAVGATEVQTGGGATSMSLHASTFSLYTITASVEPSGGGSVTLSPSEGPYVAGTEVTVTANAAPGYRFDHWSGDVTGTNDTIVLSIDSDKSITAHFVEIAETPWVLIGGTIAAVVIGVIVAVIFFRRK